MTFAAMLARAGPVTWADLCRIAPDPAQRKQLGLDILEEYRAMAAEIGTAADATLERLGVYADMIDDATAAYASSVTETERAWLTKRGATCPLIGCVGARGDGDRWVPDSEAPRAFVFPCFETRPVAYAENDAALDAFGAPIPTVDHAAWRPSAPAVVTLRYGLVPALGDYNISTPDDEPLKLWSTPLAWAAAGLAGAVVLDWRAVVGDLLMHRHIVCDSLVLAERLNEEIARERKRMVARKPEVGVSDGA